MRLLSRALALLAALALAPASAQTISNPGGGAIVPTYQGLVSNNLYGPVQTVSANTLQSRTPFFARDDIKGPCRIRMPWYYIVNSGWETGSGLGSGTFTVKLEYPAGTYTSVTFPGGAATGTAPAGGVVWSDFFTPAVPIPSGAQGWWRTFVSASTAAVVILNRGSSTGATGGGVTFGTNLTDRTGDATFTPSSPHIWYGPDAFVCPTSKRSFLVTGDSREQDLSTYSDRSFDYGVVGRSLGGQYAFTSVAVSGGSMGASAATPAARTNTFALAAYVTDLINELGYNDRSSATTTLPIMQGWYAGAKAVNPALRIGQTTIFSGTTSTTPISALTASGTTATATIGATQAAQLWVGEGIRIAGATPSGYNGSWTVTAISGQNVSFTVGTSGLATATTPGTLSDLWQSKDTHAFQVPAVSTDQLAILNSAIRQSLSGLDYYIEVADFFDDGRDTRYLKPGLTIDGVHPNSAGNIAFKQSGGLLTAVPGLVGK